MISILSSWSQIGESIGYLHALGTDKLSRVYHTTPLKNWDLAQVAKLLNGRNRKIRILDMGCGGSNVLRFCYRQKFSNVYGIDLTINFHDRLQQIMYWKNNNFKLPYHLSSQSVTQTSYDNEFFDVLICLSVIEHNVSVSDFLNESSRLLKKGGILYLSTDYRENKIDTSQAPLNYGGQAGKEWNVFSRKKIVELIERAKSYSLDVKDSRLPHIRDYIVEWNSKKYTFLSLVFIRR